MPNISGLSVNSLSCANSSILPKAESSVPYLASFIATYTGGSGSSYPAQDVTSTGVTGLTAHLDSGVLNNGDGNLVYVITGTPTTTGSANFTITIGEKSCSFSISVVEKGKGGSTSCPTDYSNCTYKSVTLSAGENFILPPGAEIISVTDPTVLQSENGCFDDQLANLPESACYFIEVSDSDCPSSGVENLNSIYITGFYVGNIFYPFTAGAIEVDSERISMFPGFLNPSGNINNSRFFKEFQLIFGPLSFKTATQQHDSDYGSTIWYVLKIPKEIGDNLKISTTSDVANAGSGTGFSPDLRVLFPARPLSEWNNTITGAPTCP